MPNHNQEQRIHHRSAAAITVISGLPEPAHDRIVFSDRAGVDCIDYTLAHQSNTDTRIFSSSGNFRQPYFSTGYRGGRCFCCINVHNGAQLIHAKLTHLSLGEFPYALMLANRIESPVLRDINYKNADTSSSARDGFQ
jgi:hypothetical protein